jgi:hypothetical protein
MKMAKQMARDDEILDLNNGVLQHTHVYVPAVLVFQYSPVKALSVPFWRAILGVDSAEAAGPRASSAGGVTGQGRLLRETPGNRPTANRLHPHYPPINTQN